MEVIIITKKIITPLRYPGGKYRASNNIISYINSDYEEYRELFLGGGSVLISLLQRYPHKKYLANDINYDLMCFWKQLQKNCNELVDRILGIKNNVTNGKKLYYDLTKYGLSNKDELEKAVRFYILNRITYSGTVDSGGYSEGAFKNRFTKSRIYDLYDLSSLIKNVEFYNKDYSNFLKKGDKNTLIYLDPPYYDNKESKLYGNNGDLHENFDHLEFIKNVESSDLNIIITLDYSDIINKNFLNKSKFNIYPLYIQYSMDNVNGNKPKYEKEVIITNYLTYNLIPKSRT
jgi:DNA adenine methylase